MIKLFQIIILSLTQALTEFLPISSSGHLKLIKDLFNINFNDNGLFETVIQFGSTTALIILYSKVLFGYLFSFFKEKKSQKFFINMIIASLPSMICGVIFYKIIKTYFNSIYILAISLIIGGIIMLFVENKERKETSFNIDEVSYKQAFLIGLCQCLALIPGVSRSGSTIVGGLINGVDRKTSVEFSFFLSIPVILLASCYDIFNNFHLISKNNIANILIGFVLTFIFTIPIIKKFITFISKNSLKGFAYYRISIGFILIILGILGYVRIYI